MSTYTYGRVESDLGSTRQRPAHHAQPPPLLTTSLNNAHSLQHGLAYSQSQVPMSATTLSSPFSLNSASPISASTNAAVAGAMSPVAYNPQEWARRDTSEVQHQHLPSRSTSAAHIRRDSETTVYAPRIHGPDEPVRSPPPPYSTNPIDASPAESTPSNQFSPAYMPSSASTCMSPACTSAQTSPRNAHVPPPPPPPPPPSSSSQSTSLQALHQNTQLALQAARPPSSRRAASAGDANRVHPARSPLGLHSETPNQTRHGFALPPPPPGPPPRPLRSMSLNRAEEVTHNDAAPRLAHRTRRPPALGTELEPVPPTPADWAENGGDGAQEQGSEREYVRGPEALQIRTKGLSGVQSSETPASATRAGQDSFSSLVRSPAVRNRSSSALRDRRSASRAGRVQSPDIVSPGGEDPLSQPLENLVLSNRGSSLADRRRSGRFTPKSGGSFQALDAALGNTRSPPQSARSFGRTPNSARSHLVEQVVERKEPTSATNDVTPHAGQYVENAVGRSPQATSTRAPPSPRSQQQQQQQQQQIVTPKSGGLPGRPVSHLLHLPNDDANVKTQPLSPQSPHSLIDSEDGHDLSLIISHSEDLFVAQSIERHRLFIEQEAAARTDAEKLQHFVQFMLQESRLRRVRYGEVFEDDNIQLADLLKDMFTLPASLTRPASQALSYASRPASSRGADRRYSASSSGTSFAESPLDRSRASTNATSDRPLKLDTSVADGLRRREGAFVPALSPIASMSAVTGKDEMESRGRPASRWWEEGSTGSARGLDVMGRSKRESKYMSALIEDERVDYDRGGAGSSSVPPPQYEGPREYPLEKGGFSAQGTPTFQPTARRAPFDNGPNVLDVSHFTTLPPPYPRRHPAVNNSHPELADTRAILRTLNDLNEVESAKQEFERQSGEKRSRANSWSKHQRSMHEHEMEYRITQRDITRQEYDDAMFALEDRVFNAKKEAVKKSFDLYQEIVVTPIHSFLNTRIAIANNTMDSLTQRLLDRSSTPLPDQPQTEGDSQPELLEKLTLLKWLFEARETLHKTQFDIITTRNNLYEELALLPYLYPGTEMDPALVKKKKDTEDFFGKDMRNRKRTAGGEAITRWTTLEDTIRSAVEMGVQSQLSAFWDIAPQLQELLQQIPSDTSLLGKRRENSPPANLSNLEILVPRHEVDETPAYWDHPLRYLYSVMAHAEASTRQFIDAQISLWCLEQEIREGVARARERDEFYQPHNDSNTRSIQQGLDDLKEKVSVIEGQWAEGLGAEFERVKHGVKGHLETTGGWDEELEQSMA